MPEIQFWDNSVVRQILPLYILSIRKCPRQACLWDKCKWSKYLVCRLNKVVGGQKKFSLSILRLSSVKTSRNFFTPYAIWSFYGCSFLYEQNFWIIKNWLHWRVSFLDIYQHSLIETFIISILGVKISLLKTSSYRFRSISADWVLLLRR